MIVLFYTAAVTWYNGVSCYFAAVLYEAVSFQSVLLFVSYVSGVLTLTVSVNAAKDLYVMIFCCLSCDKS